MVEYYPRPTANDTIGFLELASYTNTVAGGLLFPVILMVLWVIILIATKQFNTSKAVTYASFVCLILAVPLALLDLINPTFMYIFGILLASGLVWLKLEGGGKPF